MLLDGFKSIMTHLALNGEAHDDTMLVLVGNPELFFHGQLLLSLRLVTASITYASLIGQRTLLLILLHLFYYSPID